MLQLDLILEQLLQLDLTPFVLAILVGAVIGLERQFHGRPAGLRTNTLVCLASTILVYASQTLPTDLVTGGSGDALLPRVVFDPNRLAAGIVTGIGFLGAAVVIRAGDLVRGITTGACVWAVAVLGIVIGQGRYGLAVAGMIVMLAVLVIFDRVFAWVTPVVYRRMIVRGQSRELGALVEAVRAALKARGIVVQDYSGELAAGSEPFRFEFHVRCRNHQQAPEVLEHVCGIEGVTSAAWSQLAH
jgi:putative Mg2+ transporter-C (MgtC) family protein